MKKILFLFAILPFALNAKRLNVMINYSIFQDAQQQPYVETYFSVDGNSVKLAKLPNGSYQGGIEVLVTFSTAADSIVLADKFRLTGPEVADTTTPLTYFLHQGRYSVPQGEYTLKIVLTDLHNKEETYTLSQNVRIKSIADKLVFSDIQLLESYKEAATPGAFSKSGFDLVPLVSGGTYFLPEEMTKLQFYLELYNAQLLGEDPAFLFKYFIEDANRKKILPAFTGFKKQQGAPVNALLAGFNIEKLGSGNYILHIQALNKKGEVISEANTPFFRVNQSAIEPIADYLTASAAGTFTESLHPDSILLFVDYLYPISSAAERRMESGLLENREVEQARVFFLSFWKNRDELEPEKAWLTYKKEVQKVNGLFNTRITPGYRTDRGRVFLQYGPPSLEEDRRYESSSYPYIIWQYNQLESASTFKQVNKVFIFGLMELAGNNYRLIHSNATGEMFNPRWMNDLMKRDMQTRDLDETFYDYQNPGSRANSNIIINGGSINTINRQ